MSSMDLLINHQDSGTFNDHVQRENLTKEYEMEICIDSENDIAIDLSRVDSESSIISHIENDFQEKSSFLEEQLSKLSGSLREVSKPSVSYRTELKRPDLKGTFRCSICQKIFCHSSSLSRHRMQAHFKSYTCTLCRKEITSNETLRMHMAKQHSIARLFMCRCCNWAFPDKTSLHMHVQAKEEGKSVSLPILGKGVPPSSDLLGNFPIHGLMPPGLGHATPQSLTHGNPFASLHSMANAVAGLPFSSESLAQFFPPFSLMQQNNEELMSKLRERLFLNNNPPWQPFPDPSRNTLMTKLSKKDLPSNASGSDGLDQSVESVSSNSSTDDSEEIQVIEDVESHENQDRPKTCDVPADSANYNNTSEKDSMSSSESGRLVNHIPESYYNSDTLRVDENEDSPLNIVDPIEENPGQNGNDNSPTATNSSASPSNSSSSASATSCCQCNLLKTKLAVIQTKCSYLEVHSATTQQEALRLRKQNELLISKLLECREKTLSFMHSEQSLPFVLNEILKVTLFQ